MQSADILVKGATVMTMDPERRIFSDGAVAISGRDIVAVGATSDLERQFEGKKTINATGCIVMPGLVNAHTHVNQILLRGGLSQDRELYDWMFNVLIPGLAQYGPDDAATATRLYCAEAIRAGITTVVAGDDQGRDPRVAHATLKGLQASGIRAVYAPLFYDLMPEDLARAVEIIRRKAPTVNHPSDLMESGLEAVANTEELIKQYHGSADGRISVWPAPALPLTTTEEALLASAELAEKYDILLSVHCAEGSYDSRVAGMSTMEYLESIGFLSPRVQAAHCVRVNSRDIRLMSIRGVKVVHNPVANLNLSDGIAPIPEMLAYGVTVGLGTDDVNCNESINLLSDMKIAALLHKGFNRDSGALTAEQVVDMATIEGACACGLEGEVGSLEPGKRADLIVIERLGHAQMWPLHNVPNGLVYQAYGNEVATTIVNGQILMEDRALTLLPHDEEQALCEEAQAASERIAVRAGFPDPGSRGWRTAGL